MRAVGLVLVLVVMMGCGVAERESIAADAPGTAERNRPMVSAPPLAGSQTTDSVPDPKPQPCVSENGYMPAPRVLADGVTVEASLGVYEYCGPHGGHGDGPLMLAEPAVVLAATGEVVVEVGPPFEVEIRWAGEPFASAGNGMYVSAGATPGCHPLRIDVSDPASQATAWYGVDVAMQSSC